MLSWAVVSVLSVASIRRVESYVLVPLYHPLSYIYHPGPLLHTPYIQISPLQPQPEPELEYSTLDKGSAQLIVFLCYYKTISISGLQFSPTRKTPKDTSDIEDLNQGSQVKGRIAGRNLDLCYFLGSDIFTSHVPCNPNWGDGTNEGVRRYINELTFETNRMVGENNMRLTWKGPYERHDSTVSAAPSNPTKDVLSVANYGCDAVVFLVFNKFSQDCKTQTFGHDFGGVSAGGMCEQAQGRGYTVVVDQVSQSHLSLSLSTYFSSSGIPGGLLDRPSDPGPPPPPHVDL